MIEHSYRSYLFARALGHVDGVECDEEALFAATMFHDYAFPKIETLTDRCFTLAGAEEAERSSSPRRCRRTFATTSSTRSASTSALTPRASGGRPSTSPTTESRST